MTELPTPPDHDGLVFQEWNWTLEQIKSSSVGADVGANYDTVDGSIKLHINIQTQKEMAWQITVQQDKDKSVSYVGATVDWGDGVTTVCDAKGEATAAHTYTKRGRYVVTIHKGAGMTCVKLSASYQVGLFSPNRSAETAIEEVYVGSDCGFIFAYAFYQCIHLKKISLSSTVKISGTYNYNIFQFAKSLQSIVIPRTNTSIKEGLLTNCVSLRSVCLPPTVMTIAQYFVYGCTSIQRVIVPDSVVNLDGYGHFGKTTVLKDLRIGEGITTISQSFALENTALVSVTISEKINKIETQAFYGCNNIAEYHIKSQSPPTLTDKNAFAINTIAGDKTKIYVPKSCADAYKTATNWAALADYIIEEE